MPTVPPSSDFLTQHASILVFLAAIVGLGLGAFAVVRLATAVPITA